jgi:hypothetical protein
MADRTGRFPFFKKIAKKLKSFPNSCRYVEREFFSVLVPANLQDIMSHPHDLPENTALDLESHFPFDDWELSGEFATKETPLFDGKIIARMPDLGSESLCHDAEDSKSQSFWRNIGSSIASMIQGTAYLPPVAGKHFLHRFTAIGCVVILCGIGILLLEREEQSNENTLDVSEMMSEIIKTPPREVASAGIAESAFVPVLQSEPVAVVIPAAPVEKVAAVPPPSVPPPKPTESVWDRSVSDSYSPWNIAPRSPESLHDEVASGEIPSAPTPPSETVAMVPMVDMSMPVSPYEQQWLAQANPPVNPPVDPFMQINNNAVHGMVPMHERQGNVPGTTYTQNYVQRPGPPPHLQNVPPTAVQGVHTQYSQYAPPTVQPNVPIPSGASTLPVPGGYYPHQQPNGTASSVPPPGEFYNAPPTHRRIY